MSSWALWNLVHAAPKQHSLAHAFALPFTILGMLCSRARRACNLNRTRNTNKTVGCPLRKEGHGGDWWREGGGTDYKERFYGNHWPNRTKIGQFLILKPIGAALGDLWQINSSLSVPLINGNNTASLSGEPLVVLRWKMLYWYQYHPLLSLAW